MANKHILHKANGITYILTDCYRTTTGAQQPNFDGTHMALVGVLKNNQSYNDWKSKMDEGEPKRRQSEKLFGHRKNAFYQRHMLGKE